MRLLIERRSVTGLRLYGDPNKSYSSNRECERVPHLSYSIDIMARITIFNVIALAVVFATHAQVFALNPPAPGTDVPALLRAAEEALAGQDFASAAKALQSAVESQPDLVPAWFNLAYAYSGLHQNDDA